MDWSKARHLTDEERERIAAGLKTQCGKEWQIGDHSYYCMEDREHKTPHRYLVELTDQMLAIFGDE